MTLQPGRRLGHYLIGPSLGAGGMGEVYRATDTKLGRDVALKVLPDAMASSPDLVERFRREARAVAALNHPHIVTLYSFEEADRLHFLTMELIEGESLEQVIARGPVPVSRLFEIAEAVAGALVVAHVKGIVHRDLKPANVMLTQSGAVKVLDFGLARFSTHPSTDGAADQPTIMRTSTGMIMGTAPYMSPEQVQGSDVDHRTDVYSFGVLLYEVATCKRPFDGGSATGVFAAILRDAAAPVTDARPDLPPALADVIARCLERNPDLRFQTAADCATAVKRIRLQTSASARVPAANTRAAHADLAALEPPSIAVLPFANLSADPENQYFSDGLSEEIINALTRVPGLRVIARTSAFRFRGAQDVRAVGEALGVRTVLEGSVRKAGQRLRITAQLVDVFDQSHIWSERFDREVADLFDIQDEIAQAIAAKLHVKLVGAQPVAARQTHDLQAYEALLEARHFFSQFTPEGTARAAGSLARALTLAPDYPDALSLQALYHVMRAYMFEDPRVELERAREMAARALNADGSHGDARAAMALVIAWMDRDWAAAERGFLQALAVAPASARVHELHGLVTLLGTGRIADALAELDRAIQLDPLSALYAGNRGRVLTCARRFADAEASCRRGLALDPGQLLAQVELIYALTFQHKFVEAHAIGRKSVEATHANAIVHALAVSLAVAGKQDEALQLVASSSAGDRYRSPLTAGLVYAASGDMDAAFEYVSRALDELDPLLMYLTVHPMFDVLRSDPRYAQLVRRMNLEWRSAKRRRGTGDERSDAHRPDSSPSARTRD